VDNSSSSSSNPFDVAGEGAVVVEEAAAEAEATAAATKMHANHFGR
jgi:hypothetical protein